MSRFSDYWASQCGNPRGVIGKIMTWSMNRANRVIYRGIVDEINIYNDMKLLDIGFGNGYLDKLIYKKGKCFIQGIDISEDMVKLATANNRTVVDNGDMKCDIGDCCDLSYADSSFDVVVTMNTIYFWKDTLEGLREIYRVLKENGIFYRGEPVLYPVWHCAYDASGNDRCTFTYGVPFLYEDLLLFLCRCRDI